MMSAREQVHRRHADGSAFPRRRITSVPFPPSHLVATALIRQTSIVSYQSALTAAAQLAAMCLPRSWSWYTPPRSISFNHVAWILPGHVFRTVTVMASSTIYSAVQLRTRTTRSFSAPARIVSLTR